MATNYSPKIVTDSLVAYWDAADKNSFTSGSTTWTDLSGNGNNATLSSGTMGTVSGSNVIALDGADDYLISTPSGLSHTGNFTFDIWFKFRAGDSVGGGAHIIGGSALGDGDLRASNGFAVNLTVNGTGDLKVHSFNGGGGGTDFDTGLNVTVGETAHVGYIHNSGVSKAGFKNGVVMTPNTRWGTQNFTYTVLGGDLNDAVSGNYITQMAHPIITYYAVRIYNRALSAKEISQNFNAQRSRFGV